MIEDKLSAANASFPSRMTFAYFDPTIIMGWKNPLNLDNLPKLSMRYVINYNLISLYVYR
jgi:hypothetical protein